MEKNDHKSHGNGQTSLSRRQANAIPVLLTAKSVEEAASITGVAKNSLYRWLRDEYFKAELARQRDFLVRGALDHLKVTVNRAVETLVDLMEPNYPPGVRHSSARDVIAFVVKSIEIEGIESRVERLEQRILSAKEVYGDVWNVGTKN